MRAKKLLEELNGNFKKAEEILRKEGFEKVAKRADRATAQGLIETYVHHSGKVATMIELLSETDLRLKVKFAGPCLCGSGHCETHHVTHQTKRRPLQASAHRLAFDGGERAADHQLVGPGGAEDHGDRAVGAVVWRQLVHDFGHVADRQVDRQRPAGAGNAHVADLEREDGRDVGRAIQAMAPTCRVIACSGDASVLLADLALPAGWEFVPKPSDKCDWCEVLGRMLANGRASC